MNVLKPHVSLNISNIDASVAFYEKAFGVTATKRRPGYAKFDLQSPTLNLTMQEAPRTGVNASHFGVQVATMEDVIEAKGRFVAEGPEDVHGGGHGVLLRRAGQGVDRGSRRQLLGGVRCEGGCPGDEGGRQHVLRAHRPLPEAGGRVHLLLAGLA
jgi:catechol 2,3-dioxygenase-like lactoylglutathione lyase family enzyme